MNTQDNEIENVVEIFRYKLEKVLDEQFPKIEEEGPEKIANKRGAGLVLFVEAITGFRAALTAQREAIRKEVFMECIKELNDYEALSWKEIEAKIRAQALKEAVELVGKKTELWVNNAPSKQARADILEAIQSLTDKT